MTPRRLALLAVLVSAPLAARAGVPSVKLGEMRLHAPSANAGVIVQAVNGARQLDLQGIRGTVVSYVLDRAAAAGAPLNRGQLDIVAALNDRAQVLVSNPQAHPDEIAALGHLTAQDRRRLFGDNRAFQSLESLVSGQEVGGVDQLSAWFDQARLQSGAAPAVGVPSTRESLRHELVMELGALGEELLDSGAVVPIDNMDDAPGGYMLPAQAPRGTGSFLRFGSMYIVLSNVHQGKAVSRMMSYLPAASLEGYMGSGAYRRLLSKLEGMARWSETRRARSAVAQAVSEHLGRGQDFSEEGLRSFLADFTDAPALEDTVERRRRRRELLRRHPELAGDLVPADLYDLMIGSLEFAAVQARRGGSAD